MKKYKSFDGEHDACENADIVEHLDHILHAHDIWTDGCKAYVRANGDKGTCVLGAGIAVPYMAPGKRKVDYKIILHVPYTAAQGSLTWEGKALQETLDLLHKVGLTEAYYHAGYMD